MKTKSFLLFFLATAMYASSWAQCSTPAKYLNSAYETNKGFYCDFLLEKPVCDTFLGITIQWKGASDANWTSYSLDSLDIFGSEIVYGFHMISELKAGVRYQWRVRMTTYKHNGNHSYSTWTKGTPFIPQVLAGSGCTYPGPLCLFTPSSSVALFVFNNYPPTGWYVPTKFKLQYKVAGTSAWTTINNIDVTNSSYYLNILNAGTTYNWRMNSKCSTNGNSVWQNGPDFTTASLASKAITNDGQRQNFIVNSSDVKQVADDESTDQANPDILNVTPNPASSQINISLNTFKTGVALMMIKDLSGNVKWSASNVNMATLKNMTVNVSNFMPGIYSLQVICNDTSVISQKIIISR